MKSPRVATCCAAILLAASVVVLSSLSGCKSATAPPSSGPAYRYPAVPESVLVNLSLALQSLDATEATRITTSSYAFRFPGYLVEAGSPDSLTRDGWAAMLTRLFQAERPGPVPAVDSVQLSTTIVAIDNDTRPGHAGWKRYRVRMGGSVHFTNGNGNLIYSDNYLYFRTSLNQWALAEWDELGTYGDAGWASVFFHYGMYGEAAARPGSRPASPRGGGLTWRNESR